MPLPKPANNFNNSNNNNSNNNNNNGSALPANQTRWAGSAQQQAAIRQRLQQQVNGNGGSNGASQGSALSNGNNTTKSSNNSNNNNNNNNSQLLMMMKMNQSSSKVVGTNNNNNNNNNNLNSKLTVTTLKNLHDQQIDSQKRLPLRTTETVFTKNNDNNHSKNVVAPQNNNSSKIQINQQQQQFPQRNNDAGDDAEMLLLEDDDDDDDDDNKAKRDEEGDDDEEEKMLSQRSREEKVQNAIAVSQGEFGFRLSPSSRKKSKNSNTVNQIQNQQVQQSTHVEQDACAGDVIIAPDDEDDDLAGAIDAQNLFGGYVPYHTPTSKTTTTKLNKENNNNNTGTAISHGIVENNENDVSVMTLDEVIDEAEEDSRVLEDFGRFSSAKNRTQRMYEREDRAADEEGDAMNENNNNQRRRQRNDFEGNDQQVIQPQQQQRSQRSNNGKDDGVGNENNNGNSNYYEQDEPSSQDLLQNCYGYAEPPNDDLFADCTQEVESAAAVLATALQNDNNNNSKPILVNPLKEAKLDFDAVLKHRQLEKEREEKLRMLEHDKKMTNGNNTTHNNNNALTTSNAALRAVLHLSQQERIRLEQEKQILSRNPNRKDWYGLPRSIQESYRVRNRIEKLHGWQDEVLLRDDVCTWQNFVYSLPTSGGKSLVSEVCMLRCLRHRRKHAMLIVPFVALVEEKLDTMKVLADVAAHPNSAKYSKANQSDVFTVGIEGYYDTRGRFPPPSEPSVFVCTIEKATGLINHFLETDRFSEIGCIVVDELHTTGDPHRGVTLEMLLAKVVCGDLKFNRPKMIEKLNAILDEEKMKASLAIRPSFGCVGVGVGSGGIDNSNKIMSAMAATQGNLTQLTQHRDSWAHATSASSADTEQSKFLRKHVMKILPTDYLGCQVIGMSATIPNLHVLGHWLGEAGVYIGDYRPIPLSQYLICSAEVHELKPKKLVPLHTLPEDQQRKFKKFKQVTTTDDYGYNKTVEVEVDSDGEEVKNDLSTHQDSAVEATSTSSSSSLLKKPIKMVKAVFNPDNLKVVDERDDVAILVNKGMMLTEKDPVSRLFELIMCRPTETEEETRIRIEKEKEAAAATKAGRNSSSNNPSLSLPIPAPPPPNNTAQLQSNSQNNKNNVNNNNNSSFTTASSVSATAANTSKYPPLRKVNPDGTLLSITYYRPHSTIIFCTTRANCCDYGYKLTSFLSRRADLSHERRHELSNLMEELRHCAVSPDGVKLREMIPIGVAFHNASLNSDEREIVERAFKSKLVQVLFATSTLAAGVNLPARRVIIVRPLVGIDFMKKSMFLQMCGRAGRAGLDTRGECFLMVDHAELNRTKNELIFGTTERTQSGLAENLLAPPHSWKPGRDPPPTKIPEPNVRFVDSFAKALLEIVVTGLATNTVELKNCAKQFLFYFTRFTPLLPPHTAGGYPRENEDFTAENIDEQLFDRYLQTALKRLVNLGLVMTEEIFVDREVEMTRQEIEEECARLRQDEESAAAAAAEQQGDVTIINEGDDNSTVERANGGSGDLRPIGALSTPVTRNANSNDSTASRLHQQRLQRSKRSASTATTAESELVTGEDASPNRNNSNNNNGTTSSPSSKKKNNSNDNNKNALFVKRTKIIRELVQVKVSPTPFGSGAVRALFKLDVAKKMKQELDKVCDEGLIMSGELHICYFLTPPFEVPASSQKQFIDWVKFGMIFENIILKDKALLNTFHRIGLDDNFVRVEVENARNEFNIKSHAPEAYYPYEKFWLALRLRNLLLEHDVDFAQMYGCSEMEVNRLQKSTAQFAGSIVQFCETLGMTTLHDALASYVKRVQLGVKAELVPIAELEGNTAFRARILYDIGYKTVMDLMNANPEDILRRWKDKTKHMNPKSGAKNFSIMTAKRINKSAYDACQKMLSEGKQGLNELETKVRPNTTTTTNSNNTKVMNNNTNTSASNFASPTQITVTPRATLNNNNVVTAPKRTPFRPSNK